MTIQYASDLHLEFSQNKKFLKENPLQPKGDVLLLAGDIVPFAVMDKHSDFFDFISDHFDTTYWIPGNHEYYHFDLADRCGVMNEKIKSNVFLVNNYSVQYKKVKFIFSTLWSKISAENQWSVQQGLSDFHAIRYWNERFTPLHFNQLHEESLLFIQQEIRKGKSESTVVVTHHVPTFMYYPEQYKGDVFNEAFAVELYDFIEPSDIDYWLYGHHHQNTDDFEIGNTKLITNQLGYVKHNEHLAFQREAIIDLC